jgi:hypothetical protein
MVHKEITQEPPHDRLHTCCADTTGPDLTADAGCVIFELHRYVRALPTSSRTIQTQFPSPPPLSSHFLSEYRQSSLGPRTTMGCNNWSDDGMGISPTPPSPLLSGAKLAELEGAPVCLKHEINAASRKERILESMCTYTDFTSQATVSMTGN